MNGNILSGASIMMHSLGWTLLYSLWQGLLIYACLFVLLKLMVNANARVKYVLSFSALSTMLVCFAGTWISQFQRLKGITVYVTQNGGDPISAKTYAVTTIPQDPSSTHLLSKVLPQLEHYMPVITMLYFMGLLFMVLRVAINLVTVQRLKTTGISLPGKDWNDWLALKQEQFNIGRRVALYFSEHIDVPMMMGVLKPTILLPFAVINNLSTEQLEAILLHELAHIKRHDYLLNMIQSAAETILFFNPFAWLVSALVRREREHCCDDLVVSNTFQPLQYAKALAMLEHTRHKGKSLALAATGNKNQLFHRIKRIMEMKRKSINYSQLLLVLVCIAAITVSVAWFAPSFAQTVKDKKEDKGKKTQVTEEKNADGSKTTTTTTTSDNGKKSITKEVIINDGDGSNADAPEPPLPPMPPVPPVPPVEIDGDIDGIAPAVIAQVMESIKNVDWDQINKEISNAQKELDAIDWDKISASINDGMKEVEKLNDPKLKKELSDELSRELENAKREVENAKREVASAKKMREEAKAECNNVRVYSYSSTSDGDEAKAEKREEHKHKHSMELVSDDVHFTDGDKGEMLTEMEKDGLINKDKGFKIVKDDEGLFINNRKQPADVYNKYKSYLGEKEIKIKGSKGSMTVNISDDND